MKSAFNSALHAFRGFAILNITAIHVLSWPFYIIRERQYDVPESFGLVDASIGILLHDSTLYFTFISAILFSTVLKAKGYPRFFRSKFTNVFFPFLVFTLFATALKWDFSGLIPFHISIESLPVYLGSTVMNLLTGNSLWIYWYIPILLSLFVVTPLLDRLPSLPGGYWLCGIIILAPLVCSRVWPAVSWTTYVYFLGAYLLGMLVGKHYEQAIAFISKFKLSFIIVAIVTTGWFFVTSPFGPVVFGTVNLQESVWYIQKIAFAALVLLWFERKLTTVPKWLDVLANYAFALYFIHMFIVAIYFSLLDASGLRLDNSAILTLNFIVSYPLVLSVCVAFIFLFKKVLGRYSRYILGS